MSYISVLVRVENRLDLDFTWNSQQAAHNSTPWVSYRDALCVYLKDEFVLSPYVAGLYHFFMRQVDINNKPSWVRSVKTLLSRTGFGDVWVKQGVGDIDIFMNIFKQRLIDTFHQEWHRRLQESNRARFYRVVKTQHQLSKYLQCITCKPHRMALSRFIMSSHCLCVEARILFHVKGNIVPDAETKLKTNTICYLNANFTTN